MPNPSSDICIWRVYCGGTKDALGWTLPSASRGVPAEAVVVLSRRQTTFETLRLLDEGRRMMSHVRIEPESERLIVTFDEWPSSRQATPANEVPTTSLIGKLWNSATFVSRAGRYFRSATAETDRLA